MSMPVEFDDFQLPKFESVLIGFLRRPPSNCQRRPDTKVVWISLALILAFCARAAVCRPKRLNRLNTHRGGTHNGTCQYPKSIDGQIGRTRPGGTSSIQ